MRRSDTLSAQRAKHPPQRRLAAFLAASLVAVAAWAAPSAVPEGLCVTVPIETVQADNGNARNPLVISTGLSSDPSIAEHHMNVRQPARLVDSQPAASKTTHVAKLYANDELVGGEATLPILRGGLHSFFGCDDFATQGTTFEFEGRTWKPGDKISATFEYPCVGVYENEPIGARFSIAGTYVKIWPKLDCPVIQLPDLLYAGGYLFNMRDTDMSIEFFYCSDKRPVELSGSYLTFCSLNYYPPSKVEDYPDLPASGDICSESVLVPAKDTKKIALSQQTNMRTKSVTIGGTEYIHAYPVSNEFEDHLGKPTYTKNAVTLYQDGRFTVKAPFTGWFSFASASLGAGAPPAPQKTADRETVVAGQPVVWDVSQKVGTLGEDVLSRYRRFEIVDHLPDALEYRAAKVVKEQNGKKEDVTGAAGKLEWNAERKELSYRFDPAWLAGSMPLAGETYHLVIETSAKGDAEASTVENTAETLINRHRADAKGSVRIERPEPPQPIDPPQPPSPPVTPDIVPTTGDLVTAQKHSVPASGTPVKAGDEIEYLVTVENTGSAPSARTLVRDPVPEGASYVEGSATAQGAYVEASDRSGAYVEWTVPSLPPHKRIELRFRATVSKEAAQNRSVILNTAFYGGCDPSTKPGDPANGQPNNATSTTVHPVAEKAHAPAQLHVVKRSDPRSGTLVKPGDTITYFIDVSHKGSPDSDAASQVRVEDPLPDGCELVEGGLPDGHSASFDASSRTVSWIIDRIEPGSATTLSFTVRVSENPEGSIDHLDNQVRYQPGWKKGDPLPNTSNTTRHLIAKGDEPAKDDRGDGKPFDKTGNALIPYWWVAGLLGLIAVGCGSVFLTCELKRRRMSGGALKIPRRR
ncbi:hypothetical protein JI75_08035 [Berryella intestinalis]|uniref:DUF11 domain-containing protein n=1 Tax=Berryella intestinalis TaxID=1531429 RepID=A0A0A8B5K0_9ACTN|nr:isopeptide-forming domain-containing fimbrial protein [Berryella intestinalis]AJC12609.1 hypothetical protein JI75_08035 [Berryella intestinalis]